MKPGLIRAVDISNHQGAILPSTVAQWKVEGISRVIVRASIEDTTKRAMAIQQMMTVELGGLELEAYCWLYFNGDESAAEQIGRTMDSYLFNHPIQRWWLDCEGVPPLDGVAPTVKAIRDALDAFTEGSEVGIYTRANWWREATNDSQEFAGMPCWVASYDGIDSLEGLESFGGFEITGKQYAENVKLAGITVDLNVFLE